ncbi:MAG: hypothetical protein KDE27_04830, partial [Planctomycetes bacterium]|nr:hypothetical protein [Planctomycetota bacterium]
PLLGTFWPAVDGDGCRLRGVTAGRRVVATERTALELKELLRANLGNEIVVRETGDIRYRATIVGLPTRSGEELAAATDTIGPMLPVTGDAVLLRTAETRRDTSAERIADAGTRLVRLDRIVDVTFLTDPKTRFVDRELAPRLVLDVDCGDSGPRAVDVELGWVEQGFRWIPSYRVEIDGQGKARLSLQATLQNDLVDLENATLHLVVGVPSFVAKGQLDPIALQESLAAAVARMPRGATQNAFSNSIMSQVSSNFVAEAPVTGGPTAAEDGTGSKEQDLYVFTVTGVSLRAGERMVLPVFEQAIEYRDVWKLDVSIAPPQESWEQFRNGPDELARLLRAPKVRHEIRLGNPGPAPLTTAPALVLQGGRVLAQGMTTYTPPGHGCDLELTTAIDLLVVKTDEETGRTPNAESWNGNSYMRVDVDGRLRVTNRRSEPVEVEIRRLVFGKLDAVRADGSRRQLNPYADEGPLDLHGPDWRRYSWYWSVWSMVMNGVGEASWTVAIEPGKTAEVGCSWHYFWR